MSIKRIYYQNTNADIQPQKKKGRLSAPETKPFNFEGLLPELQKEVLNSLPETDLVQGHFVCKEWKTKIASDRDLKQKVTVVWARALFFAASPSLGQQRNFKLLQSQVAALLEIAKMQSAYDKEGATSTVNDALEMIQSSAPLYLPSFYPQILEAVADFNVQFATTLTRLAPDKMTQFNSLLKIVKVKTNSNVKEAKAALREAKAIILSITPDSRFYIYLDNYRSALVSVEAELDPIGAKATASSIVNKSSQYLAYLSIYKVEAADNLKTAEETLNLAKQSAQSIPGSFFSRKKAYFDLIQEAMLLHPAWAMEFINQVKQEAQSDESALLHLVTLEARLNIESAIVSATSIKDSWNQCRARLRILKAIPNKTIAAQLIQEIKILIEKENLLQLGRHTEIVSGIAHFDVDTAVNFALSCEDILYQSEALHEIVLVVAPSDAATAEKVALLIQHSRYRCDAFLEVADRMVKINPDAAKSAFLEAKKSLELIDDPNSRRDASLNFIEVGTSINAGEVKAFAIKLAPSMPIEILSLLNFVRKRTH